MTRYDVFNGDADGICSLLQNPDNQSANFTATPNKHSI